MKNKIKNPYKQGFRARLANKSLKDNPYKQEALNGKNEAHMIEVAKSSYYLWKYGWEMANGLV
jgi:hypothetical protein